MPDSERPVITFEPLWVETEKGNFRVLMEPVTKVIGTMHALHQAHYASVEGRHHFGRDFQLDYEYYARRALLGRFGVIVMRNGTLEPVGYLGFGIDKSPWTGGMCATEEFWYIAPAARGTVLAQRVIEYFEYVARKLGLAELYMGYSKKDASALYEKAGLKLRAVLYGKVLDDAVGHSIFP